MNGNQVFSKQVAVSSNGPYSAQYDLPGSSKVIGAYQWNVGYSGDGNNNEVDDDNDAGEQVTVGIASPAARRRSDSGPGDPRRKPPVTPDGRTALSGGYHETGTITFSLIYKNESPEIYTDTLNVNGDGLYMPAGYTLPTTGDVAGFYQWDVTYSGDVNNNASGDSSDSNRANVELAKPTLTGTPLPAAVTLGPSPITLTDQALLLGGYQETGTISFSLYQGAGTTPVFSTSATVSGDGTYTTPTGYVPTAAGAYHWNIFYDGDANNGSIRVDNSAAEQLTVSPASPTLTSTAFPANFTLGAAPATLADAAFLSGGNQATGTITFTLYYNGGATPVDTETATVNGNGLFTTPTGYALPSSGAAMGGYQWDVSYSGDGNNNAAGDNNDPLSQVTVSAATPTLTAAPNLTSVTLGSTPVTLQDTAFLQNGFNPDGNLTFTLYGNGSSTPLHTETVSVNGNGMYATSAGYQLTTPGTYQWDASYTAGSDGNNNSGSDINAANEQVIVTAQPQISAGPALNLGTTTYGTAGAAATYDVSGNYLTSPVSITAPIGVELSTDATHWSGALTLNPVNGTLASTVIDARISARADAGGISGDITETSTGANTQYISVNGNVAPKALTVSIVGAPSKIYDGTTNATLSSGSYQIAGLVNGDNFTVTQSVGAYNSKDVATARTVTAILAAGDFVPAAGTFATQDTFPSSAAGPGPITAATLLYVANPVSRTYGSSNPAFTGGVTGQAPGDTLGGVTTGTLTFTRAATAVSNVGSYAITGAGLTADSSDYVLAQAAGNASALTITPATLTVTIVGNPSKTYDGTTTAALTPANYRIAGLLNGNTFTVANTAGAYNSKDVATATTVTVTLVAANFTPVGNALASNYAFPTSAGGPGKITPAALTVSISGDPTKPYDGTTAATLTSANFQVNGLGSGDGFTITKTAGAYNSKNVASATTVTVSLAKTDFSAAPGTLVGDYTFPASAGGPGQITPVTLTVAIVGDPTKTYDGATAATLTAANYQLSGVIKGEGFTVKQTVGTYNSKDVATASNVTASLAATNFTPTSLSGTLASNYAFPASATGAGQIRRATLTYHIGNDAQDEGIPVNLANGLPATFNTGVNGENLALSYSSLGDTAAALPGKYAIAGVIANGTGLASDYAVTLFPGTLTVNPPLRITTTTLPSYFVNVPYATTVSTTGGTGPLAFTLTAGSLPTGLKLNANGTIKGIPTVGGTFTFTITATDAFGEESNLSLTLTCSVAMHPGQWN